MKKSDVKMEDINSWIVAMYKRMNVSGLKLTKTEDKALDKVLFSTLEEFFNYPDYRSYN